MLIMDVVERMRKEMLRRKLSRNTIKCYLFYVRKFLLFCEKDCRKFSRKDCREFLERYMDNELKWMRKRGVDEEVVGSTLNVVLNSLRFMMEEVLRKSMRLNIKYSKIPKALPVCLRKDEVKLLIDCILNDKHKLLVSLMYGAGLRVSEVVKLKVLDFELEHNIGWVRKGKGNKDRPFIIPESLKAKIVRLIEDNKEKGIYFLFKGRKNSHLSVRSVQMIIKKAAAKSRISKDIHPHTLRHSFATHILENGADITSVQSLLGHSEVRTTMGYLHVMKPKLISVKSPLDTF
jgi:integrase/recombinase XerD